MAKNVSMLIMLVIVALLTCATIGGLFLSETHAVGNPAEREKLPFPGQGQGGEQNIRFLVDDVISGSVSSLDTRLNSTEPNTRRDLDHDVMIPTPRARELLSQDKDTGCYCKYRVNDHGYGNCRSEWPKNRGLGCYIQTEYDCSGATPSEEKGQEGQMWSNYACTNSCGDCASMTKTAGDTNGRCESELRISSDPQKLCDEPGFEDCQKSCCEFLCAEKDKNRDKSVKQAVKASLDHEKKYDDYIYEIKLLKVYGNYEGTYSDGSFGLQNYEWVGDTTFTSKKLKLTSTTRHGGQYGGKFWKGQHINVPKVDTSLWFGRGQNGKNSLDAEQMEIKYHKDALFFQPEKPKMKTLRRQHPVLFRGKRTEGGTACADIYDADVGGKYDYTYGRCIDVEMLLSNRNLRIMEERHWLEKDYFDIYVEIEKCPQSVKQKKYQFECGYMKWSIRRVPDKTLTSNAGDTSSQCILTLTPPPSKRGSDVTIKYRGQNTLATYKRTDTKIRKLTLHYPIVHNLDKLRINGKQLSVENVVTQTTTIYKVKDLSVDNVQVSVECPTWRQLLDEEPPPRGIKTIEACIKKTSHYLDNTEWDGDIRKFIFKGKGTDSSRINVAFVWPGLNGLPKEPTIEMENGASQLHSTVTELCSQMATKNEDFLIVPLVVMFPREEILRGMYVKLGTMYTQQYLTQAYIDPILSTLSEIYTKNRPHVFFFGFSLGGLQAMYSTIHYSIDYSSRLLAVPVILDPYSPKARECSKEAHEGAEAWTQATKKGVMESVLWVKSQRLFKCIRLKDLPSDAKLYDFSLIPHEEQYVIDTVSTFGSPTLSYVTWLDRTMLRNFQYYFRTFSAFAVINTLLLGGILKKIDFVDTYFHLSFRTSFNFLAVVLSVLKSLGASGFLPEQVPRHVNEVVFDELWPTADGSYITYITFVGKVMHNDGNIVRRMQDLNKKGAGGIPYPKVVHVNHFNDKVVGIQGRVDRSLDELGYMDGGDWTLEKAKKMMKDGQPGAWYPKKTGSMKDDPREITFNCFFAEKKGENNGFLPPLKSPKSMLDNRRGRKSVYNSKTDELPYEHKKMKLDADSEALIELDNGLSGSQTHHESHVAAVWWLDSSTPGYFHKNARLHSVIKAILESSRGGSQKTCTKNNPSVTVKVERDLDILTEVSENPHVRGYTLTSTAKPGKSFNGLDAKVTRCNWTGQDEVRCPFKNNAYGVEKEIAGCYPGPSYCYDEKTEILQGVYKTHENINFRSHCQEKCGEDSQCSRWTYHAKDKWCKLAVKGFQKIWTDERTISGPKGCSCFDEGKEYQKDPYETEENVGVSDCYAVCIGDPECTHWAHYAGTKQTCKLYKNPGNTIAKKTKELTFTGPTSCHCFADGAHYPEDYLYETLNDIISTSDCQKKCAKNKKCTNWTLHTEEKSCKLYDNKSLEDDTKINIWAISGPSECSDEYKNKRDPFNRDYNGR